MGALTNYTEDEIVKHLFRTGSFTKPAGLHVANLLNVPLLPRWCLYLWPARRPLQMALPPNHTARTSCTQLN